MNKTSKVVLLIISIGLVTACGISEEQYQAKVKEALKLKQDLHAATTANMQLQQQLAQVRAQNQTMAAKLQELGQNVQSLLGEKSMLSTDLAATKAREAKLRAEQEAQRARMAKYRAVIEKFKDLVNSGKLKIRIVNGQMVVQMASNILFETGKADLSSEGKDALKDLASILMTIKDRKFQIAGHTDNVPIRSRKFPSNWELSSARAVTVVKFLQENGVDPVTISAAGFAEYQPTASNDSEEGKAANRRIEITLLPNLDELPDLSGLEKDISK